MPGHLRRREIAKDYVQIEETMEVEEWGVEEEEEGQIKVGG